MFTLWGISDVVPSVWVVAFSRLSHGRWVDLLAWGRYKHVRAYAYVPALQHWLFYDVTLGNTLVISIPDGKVAERYILDFTRDCDLVSVQARPRQGARFSPFTCVSAIKQLIGIPSSALRPDALYRDCLAAGGVPFGKSRATATGFHAAAARPDAAGTQPAE